MDAAKTRTEESQAAQTHTDSAARLAARTHDLGAGDGDQAVPVIAVRVQNTCPYKVRTRLILRMADGTPIEGLVRA